MDNFDKDIFTFDDVTNIVFFSSGDYGSLYLLYNDFSNSQKPRL